MSTSAIFSVSYFISYSQRVRFAALRNSNNSLQEYLDLRRSYQEDVRLGIFTPAEAKQHIEALDKQRAQLER